MNTKFLRALLVGEFSWRRLVRSMILIPVFVLLGLFIIAIFFADRAIFRPQPSSYKDSADIIKLKTVGEETISAKYYENPQAEYTILFSHGNAEDIGMIEPFVWHLRDLGFNVLTYDYQGYGTSGGSPSETNAYADIDAAYKYLRFEKGVLPSKIILHGRSLGGGIAVDLASREEVGGLILESTFITAFRVITRYPIFPFDKFESIKKMNRFNCPTLVIHGTHDRTIPLYHGERLFEAATGPKYSRWVEGAEHNNVYYQDEKGYLSSIAGFIATLPAD